MKDWQIELLACPFEHEPLDFEGEQLFCPKCKRNFPIVGGIPSFVVSDLAQAHNEQEWQWKQSEMRARNQQAVFYDRLLGLIFLTPFEAQMTVNALLGDRKKFANLIEIGCGTGRMLQHFAKHSEFVIGADLSLESLNRCRKRFENLGLWERTLLVHADASFLPFRNESFDAVASCQMIEHVPSDRMRQRVVSEIARILKPKGRFAISGYHYSALTKWFGKEGVHKGGIYFFRFTREEFLKLIGQNLKVERLQTIFGYAWLASGVKGS
ncbi:MAG: class I SAM-dependent methyltransferase [Armatimonadetes bacterium]|nr:class I SAM-dependent methyltransferase [Armatimonadota bacterium]MDW8029349.1 methyltransferase domain-containing protein [Armatimonadota bacterium]